MSPNQKQRKQHFLVAILSQLGWALLWGMAAWVGFYTLLSRGVIANPTIERYLTGHVVEYIEAALFFVGLAALGLRLISVMQQHLTLEGVKLPAADPGGDRPEECDRLLDALARQPARLQDTYLVRRLREAIEYVQRKGSADELDEQLRWLADVDAARQHDGYALPRLIIWAIPILGFLGTVIGITMAISGLSPESFAAGQGINNLTNSLGVAFDTTTVALALSIVLMFSQFLIERVETELLSAVDDRVNAQLVGRFQQLGTGTDPQVASIRKMADAVVHSSEQLVARQAELWQHTIEEAHQQWAQLSDAAAAQTQQALEQSLAASMRQHAAQLAEAEQTAAGRADQTIDRLARAVENFTQSAEKQHSELVRQGEVMRQAIEAAGQVSQLQQTLNDNLNALAGAQNFEETVMSLAAAIHLLNSRLSGASGRDAAVNLQAEDEATQGRAA